MTVRAVEWKKPYTWWTAIEIDENKVISLRLRDENNLIIYDAWDNEIYVDLQLPDWIRPLDAFPVGVTTGRVLVADDWDKTGTIICAKTTSGDNIKVLYADDWTLWIDNWTWIFKQIYFKADVDLIIQAIQNQIDALSWLGKFLSLWDGETWMPISFPLATPYEYHTWDWYMINVVDNTTNYRPNWTEFDWTASSTVETQATEIWDVYIYDWSTWLLQKNGGGWGSAVLFSQVLWDPYSNTNLATALNAKQDELTAWTNIQISNNVISATWWSDIVYATQAEYNALLPWALTDGKHYFIYSTDGWGWQPWVNTIAYYPFTSTTTVNDQSWNSNNLTNNGVQFWTYGWVDCASFNGSSYMTKAESLFTGSATFTVNLWVNITTFAEFNNNILSIGASNSTNSFIIWISDYTLMLWGRANDANTWYTLSWNTRLNIVVTHSWGTVKVYVNWNKEYEWSVNYTISNSQTTIWGGTQVNKYPLIWYESELIVESIARTAQEISDYYDLTKWDYWIS